MKLKIHHVRNEVTMKPPIRNKSNYQSDTQDVTGQERCSQLMLFCIRLIMQIISEL
jgi:hypothetical protein